MKKPTPSYQRHRFPSEIISHAVWLYHRFCLSFREVEELLAKRGISVTYETIRQWCQKFGPDYARKLKKRQGRLGDIWHIDEVFVPFKGNGTICGGPWTKTAIPLIFAYSAIITSKRRNASFAAYSKATVVNRDVWSPTTCEAWYHVLAER